MKAVAQWLRDTVFSDEAIRPRAVPQPAEKLPPMLRAARALEISGGQIWQSRESIFVKQARLLAHYEDEFDFQETVRCYYPTYQSLSDRELRGYFSWRTKLRKGDVGKTSLSFAFIYIYELINQAGAGSPLEGFEKLLDFRDVYGRIDEGILPYLETWLTDYAVYYDLDPALLAGSPQVLRDNRLNVLDHAADEPPEKILDAVKAFSRQYPARSKFYGSHAEDMDAVIVRVLRRMSGHYAARCKKSMVDHYFGGLERYANRPFASAVFSDPLKRRNYEYVLDQQCTYRCENGSWSVWKRGYSPRSDNALGALVKTIDAMMRDAFDYRHPVKAEIETKWIVKIIGEEIQGLLAEKSTPEVKKVDIDFARLAQIRQDAELTREKLIVDEERDVPEETPEPAPAAPSPAPAADIPLDPAEYRLVHSLLYGGDLDWVRAGGLMLSVLADAVNEKLYDSFSDSVLEDGPRVVADYIQDLKEMVRP